MIKTILVLSDGTEIFAGHNRINAIQSTSIMESSNDGEDLTLGSVCAKKIEIKIITPKNKLPIKSGDLIMVYEEENGVRRKKGNFIAEKPQKKGANTTNIVAYDNISLLDKDVTEWFNSLEGFPYTAYDMAKKVCQYCGINFANANINNGDYLIYATQLKNVTARQIVRWIGEISGCFCVADENGNAVYQWYKENSTPIVASRSENAVTFLQGGLSYEDYQTNKVDRVQIRQDKNSVGIVFPNGASGENSYIIESNPFLIEDARMVDIAESLYNIIKDITYVPCKVNVPSSYKFNVGDIVKITDTNGVEFYSYIMQKKRAGQKETLECTGNYTRNGATTLYNTSYTAGYGRDLEISKDLAKLELTTDAQGAKIEALTKRTTDAETLIAQIDQEVDTERARIDLLAEFQTQTEKNIAEIETEANAQGAKIGLIVETNAAGENAVKGAILVEAINGQSTAKIAADRLDIEGKTLNIKVDATNIDGELTADQINADGLKVTNGEIDNCTINENCIIKGVLTGDELASNEKDGAIGKIAFFSTENGVYYDFNFSLSPFACGMRLGLNAWGGNDPSVFIYSEVSSIIIGDKISAETLGDIYFNAGGKGVLYGTWYYGGDELATKADISELDTRLKTLGV